MEERGRRKRHWVGAGCSGERKLCRAFRRLEVWSLRLRPDGLARVFRAAGAFVWQVAGEFVTKVNMRRLRVYRLKPVLLRALKLGVMERQNYEGKVGGERILGKI